MHRPRPPCAHAGEAHRKDDQVPVPMPGRRRNDQPLRAEGPSALGKLLRDASAARQVVRVHAEPFDHRGIPQVQH